jgi:hypothetical protein
MEKISRRTLLTSGAALAAGGLAAAGLVTPAEAATGYVNIHIFSAGFIIGVSGGSGTLTFRGQSFPLRIGGISAGATIGASGTDLVGTASGLHAPGDIVGTYSAVGAGLSIAGGRQATQLTNGRGVILRLRGRQIGFMFSIDLSGMNINLG